jgi:Holliday junction DNA helicase RuvA
MIAFVRGIVVQQQRDAIVIDVHGIGYRVLVCAPQHFVIGVETTVHTYYAHREDHVALVGFVSVDQLALFCQLIDVNGIGLRVALGMIGGADVPRIVAAIQHDDVAFLTKLPGVGKKLAQRLVLELRDKLGVAIVDVPARSSSGQWEEVREALIGLGYSEAEIARLHARVAAQCAHTEDVAQWIAAALHTVGAAR